MSDKMSPVSKGVGLVVGASVVTMGVAVCIIALISMIFIDFTKCGSVSDGLGVLFVTIAVVFLASFVVVGIVARKVIPGGAGCWAIVAVYGVMMLASYLFIAFGLMVAFNC